jgi:hypothetical protein
MYIQLAETPLQIQLMNECIRLYEIYSTTSRNPTANSIYKRMHQTVWNILRTLLHENPPQNDSVANKMVDKALSIAQHTMRTSVQHQTLGSSPGVLDFSRDMFLNVPLASDWHANMQKRDHLVNYRLMTQNNSVVHTTTCLIGWYLRKWDFPILTGVATYIFFT